ncbi:MAG: helix-turn-helix domain-containing protein, partial [Pseudomonadales bacterium]|nr:helix-turn-helix domain-containing protein [Pseudomonadales bacterium]
MSCRAITWAWVQEVNSTQKIVLVALADHCDNDGWCWPAHETLARKCSLSERSVRRVISQLRELQKVTVKHRKDSKGHQTSNLYKLSLEDISLPATVTGGKEKEIPLTDCNSEDNDLETPSQPDKSQSDTVAGGDELDQNLTAQPDTQSGAGGHTVPPGGTACPDRGDTQSPKPSVNHHKNHHLTGGGGGEVDFKTIPKTVDDWKPVLKNLEFDEDKINSPQSIEMISEWVTQKITIGEVNLAYQTACGKAAGGKPIFPRYIRNFVVIVRKEKL